MHMDALSVLCAQLTRDLLAIAKFLFTLIIWSWYLHLEGTGRGSLIAELILTAQSSTASVPVNVLLYNGQLLCGFTAPITGLIYIRLQS